MGYGVLALQPLGDGYVSYGVVAGLMSAIIVLLAGALLGGSAGLMYTPRSVVTLIMAAVVFEGVVRGPAAVAAHGDVQRTLTLVFFVVVAAGLFQALFGALRLGSLIRYIPSPVMAGFQNAVAILIILSQVDTMLGFRRHVPIGTIASNLALVQPLTLGVGLRRPARRRHRAHAGDPAAPEVSPRLRPAPGRPPALAGTAHPGRRRLQPRDRLVARRAPLRQVDGRRDRGAFPRQPGAGAHRCRQHGRRLFRGYRERGQSGREPCQSPRGRTDADGVDGRRRGRAPGRAAPGPRHRRAPAGGHRGHALR